MNTGGWAFFGLFATALGVLITLVVAYMKVSIDGLRGELVATIEGLRAEMVASIGGLRGELVARFDTVDHRLTEIERDLREHDERLRETEARS